jgi:hypothetical protein
MSIYSITVTVFATAYIRAGSADEAKAKAFALENHVLEIEDAGSEVAISGLKLNDPELPDISLSPAMTVIGPEKDDTPELVEAAP